MLRRSKKSNGLNSPAPVEKSDVPQTTSKKSLLPEESRSAAAASARAKSDLDFIIDQLSQSSPPQSRTPPTSSQNAIEEAAQKLLSEDEKAALACSEGDFAARMAAAQRPPAKALVALKIDHTEHDSDFLSGIHNQLGALSITKHGDASGYGFVRSVLKEPKNQFEMLLVAQMLALHDAAMDSGKSLGAARTIDEKNCYGNMLSKLTRSFASHLQTLHQCRSGGERKVTFNNVSINEGGRAIMGVVSNNPGSNGTPDTPKDFSSPGDQSATTRPLIQLDEPSSTVVPRMGQQDKQPAPRKCRKR